MTRPIYVTRVSTCHSGHIVRNVLTNQMLCLPMALNVLNTLITYEEHSTGNTSVVLSQ